MERTTKRSTVVKKRVRRHVSWKNVGWFVSWSLFFSAMIQMMHCCIITIRNHGENPLDGRYWVMGIYLLIVIWTGWRNPDDPFDYIAEWKRRNRNRRKR